jgi:hypothetical protein
MFAPVETYTGFAAFGGDASSLLLESLAATGNLALQAKDNSEMDGG